VIERRLRIVSGLVIAAWVVLHLVNHSLGILSLEAMETYRRVNTLVWRSWPGTVALYGAFLVHFVIALRVIYRRTTLRMPAWEAAQIVLGLLVPPLIALHVLGTRFNHEYNGIETTYPYVVWAIWNGRSIWQQPVLVLVAWLHLCIGLHFWLRIKPWYRPALRFLYPLAVLVPTLALVGFVSAGLELERAVARQPMMLDFLFADWNALPAARRELVYALEPRVIAVFAAILAAVLLARTIRIRMRARRGAYRIHHPSGRTIAAPPGRTVLEALRRADVPHASVCGGRARCTTCRIRVGDGADALHAPSKLEREALTRIGAAPNVRLACQLRPERDLDVTPLVPVHAGPEQAYRPGGVRGREQQVAAVFVDLRGSTRLGEDKLPYDVVFVLNQFFAEMSAALEATDGHYAQFTGDGLMALYGVRAGVEQGARKALQGAAEMCRRLEALNERLASELREPLRIGIGIHSGDAIVGTMGPPASPILSAIGDTINTAARLEALTKDFGCALVVSEVAAEHAGLDLAALQRREAVVRGRAEPVAVYAVDDPAKIPGLGADAGE